MARASGRRRAAAVTIFLAAAGFGANLMSVPLLDGVDFLFGGIAGLVAARVLGPGRGALVAALAASQTLFIWGHPYAAFLLGLEAFVVGLAARRLPLVFADLLYWVVLGGPLVWLVYTHVLEMEPAACTLVALKQAANGLFAALLAAILVNHLPVARWLDPDRGRVRCSLRETLFTVLMGAVLLPGLVLMASKGRELAETLDAELLAKLERVATDAERAVRQWHEEHARAVAALAVSAAEVLHEPAAVQRHVDLVSGSFPGLVAVYVAGADGTAFAFAPPFDPDGEPTVGRPYDDRAYFRRVRDTLAPHTSEVVFGRASMQPVLVLVHPITTAGVLRGVVGGALDLTAFADRLQLVVQRSGAAVTVVDRRQRVVASTQAPDRAREAAGRRAGEWRSLGAELRQWLPEGPGNPMRRWHDAVYRSDVPLGEGLPLSLIVEQPLAPARERLYARYIDDLGTMLLITICSALFALPISAWLVGPVRRLTAATTDLPGRLAEARSVDWPENAPREIHALMENVRSTEEALRRSFGELQTRNLRLTEVNDELTRQSAERERLEAEFRQMQKMESIGTFAGGIAHDFNNLLTVIFGYLEIVELELEPDHPLHAELREIKQASHRARELVSHILAFSRRQAPERRLVDPPALLRETLTFLRPTVPASIAIRAHIDNRAAPVLADEGQLQQVLLNLCANAQQAMRDGGGVLEIALERLDLDRASARALSLSDGGAYVRLSVRDTGTGIEPSILPRIFEPFFTTRETGQGTGMGLAMVHGIVTRHGGAVTVHSVPGQGTRFDVYLPQARSSIEVLSATPTPRPAQGSERVLFVDDEPALEALCRRMLERLGYRVTSFADPRAALEAFRAAPDTFDVVITDQTMPGMTGDELARALRGLRPDVPVILCTGFSHVMDEGRAAAAGIDAFLSKPLLADDLGGAIRRVLARRAISAAA